MITEKEINKILNIIINNSSPQKIILFGSYAENNFTEDSDLDLLIIKDSNLPKPKRAIEIKKHLRGLKIPIDIIVYNNQEINKYINLKTSFIYKIMKQGKILYEC